MVAKDQPAHAHSEHAPASIEEEMEATRVRLAETIDTLLFRASPKTIAKREVNHVKAFFVDEQGGPRTDNILKLAAGVAGAVTLFVVVRKVVS